MFRDRLILVVWFLLSIILAVITGYASSYLPSSGPKDAFLFGIITFTLSSIAQLIWEFDKLSGNLSSSFLEADKKLSLNSTFLEISANPQLRSAIEKIALYALKGLALHHYNNSDSGVYKIFRNEVFRHLLDCESSVKNASLGVIRIPREMSNVFWLRVIASIEHSYRTTNLITSFSDSFGQKSEKAFLDIQQKISNKVGKENFRRIFIYETEELLQSKADLLNRQCDAGLSVKALSLESYNRLGQEQWSSKIGCSDFAIIDDEFVYITVVDDTTRKSTYVELTNDPVRLEAARILFELIDDNCDDYSSTKLP